MMTKFQQTGVERSQERKRVSKYMRGHAYDEMNLRLAREILAEPERWEPFYRLYAECVVERLVSGKGEKRPSSLVA